MQQQTVIIFLSPCTCAGSVREVRFPTADCPFPGGKTNQLTTVFHSSQNQGIFLPVPAW